MGLLTGTPGMIATATIETDLDRQGYFYLQGVGRLHKGGLTRKGLIIAAVVNIFAVMLIYGVSSLRVAMHQAEALRAEVRANALQQQLAQASQDHAQLVQCSATLTRYETTLAQATQTAQQAAPTNPNAAQMLRLLLLLKQVL